MATPPISKENPGDRRVRLSKFVSSIKGRPKRLLILKTKENTNLFPARCSYEFALVVRASSRVVRTLFVRCSYEFARARTHPRTTRRARLLGLVVPPFYQIFYLLLEFPRNSCCGIALVRAHARTSLLVCVSRSGRCSSLSRAEPTL